MKLIKILRNSWLALACIGFTSAEPEKKTELNVLSYNIRHGRGMDGKIDLERLAKVIAKYEPDLVALQEVDKNCKRSGSRDLAQELGGMLNMESRFGAFMDYQGGEYGLAILSRLPISKTLLHEQPAGGEPRTALEVQVEVNAGEAPLSFVSLHHESKGEEVRLKQVDALVEVFKDRTAPVILAGDFNALPGEKSWEPLHKDGWKVLDKKGAKTFPADEPRIEIDFFVLKNFAPAVLVHEVGDEKVASDHRPIFAKLKLAEAARE